MEWMFSDVVPFDDIPGTLPGSTLPELCPDLTCGGKFKGISAGSHIIYWVRWTVPTDASYVGDYSAVLNVHTDVPGGPDIITSSPVTFPVAESGEVTVDLSLVTGFNLIGIPVSLPTTTTSRDIAELILGIPGASDAQIQAGSVISVLGWNVGSQIYDTWAAAVPSSDIFNLAEGRGYFVRVSQNVTLPFTGPPLLAPVQIRS